MKIQKDFEALILTINKGLNIALSRPHGPAEYVLPEVQKAWLLWSEQMHEVWHQGFDARDPVVKSEPAVPLRSPHYFRLAAVLNRAYDQAATGKGAIRHGQGQPFEKQPMQAASVLIGSHLGLFYQAIKKIQESQRLPHEAAVAELLGAINYLAGAIIYLEDHEGD